MRTVMIVSASLSGHRPTYLRHLVANAEPDTRLLVATRPGELSSPGAAAQLGLAPYSFETIEQTSFDPGALADLANHHNADHVVALDGDDLALAIGKTRRWSGPRLTALIMRPRGQRGRVPGMAMLKTSVKTMLQERARHTPRVRLCTLVAPYDTEATGPGSVVDPVDLHVKRDDRTTWRARYGLDESLFWVALVGAMTERKNPASVLGATQYTARATGVLVAGPCDQATLSAIAQARAAGASVVLHNRYLSDEELDGAIVASDCTVAAHTNVGPSGIVAKSLALAVPVVLTRGASSGRRFPDNSGITHIPSTDARALARALDVVSGTKLTGAFEMQNASPTAFAMQLLTWTER